MRSNNPTQIRLGMSGAFFNRKYRVVGRAVLGVLEGGTAYYWNEFYLESAGGAAATLVFEETEEGYAWRLFTMFNPQPPMTAGEASAKKVSDYVQLDGVVLHVSRVDRSQIYYVEGKTPPGIATGQVANYFNADAGSRQVVVSWTGEEVEYYSGMTTSAPMVASAFKLQGFAAWRFMASSGRSWLSGQIWMAGALALALIAILFGCFIDLSHSRNRPPVTLTPAPVSPLRLGDSGLLNGITYKIAGHELVEMDEMGRRWQRQEYDLNAPDQNQALLVGDPGAGGPLWFLYTLLQPDNPFTPQDAGAKRTGQTVTVNGSNVSIRELFRSTVQSVEGASANKAGDVFYGFTGLLNSNTVLLVRWNQTNIIYEQGTPMQAKTVLAAFGQGAGK